MLWLFLLCLALAVIIAVQALKIHLMHISAEEIMHQLDERLDTDTNTLISLSSRDRYMRRLAVVLNSQLRQLRRERRRLQSGDVELREAVVNVSHDLRTPLTAICGYLELLRRENKSENAERYLSIIENRAEALTRLTEELFRYSIVASGESSLKLEHVSLNTALEESLSAYYGALKSAGISPEVSAPEERVTRILDRAALARVFGNIISNAVKYSTGDFAISLSPAGEIIFANSAPSLSEIQAGRLFDRFYTVEDGQKSTGLGLSISRTLTEQMGGSINATYSDGILRIHVLFPERNSKNTGN